MKRKIKIDEPIGRLRVVKDDLPRPEDLIFKRENKKRVTIELSNNSISFFKKAAQKEKASYQVMIRRLLDFYVAKQQYNIDSSRFASA